MALLGSSPPPAMEAPEVTQMPAMIQPDWHALDPSRYAAGAADTSRRHSALLTLPADVDALQHDCDLLSAGLHKYCKNRISPQAHKNIFQNQCYLQRLVNAQSKQTDDCYNSHDTPTLQFLGSQGIRTVSGYNLST